MLNAIERAGRQTSLNTIPVTVGGADGSSGAVEQVAARPSKALTVSKANQAAIKVELASPDERRQAKILSGEAPVPKMDFVASAGGQVVELA